MERQVWFGITSKTGNAADSNHNVTGQAILPRVSRNSVSNRLQLDFTRYLDRTDITLTVQANDALTDTWIDLARSENGGVFTVIAAGATVNETGPGNARAVTIGDLYQVTDPAHPRRFMQLKVTAP